MKSFDEDLENAVAQHGHLCAGQILGVRLARLGLAALGIEKPESYRDLITYIETDRCLADAVSSVTHCKLGRRRLKHKDYGKSAATFVDRANGKAVRVSSKFWINPPAGADMRAYFAALTDDELFKVEHVAVEISPFDLPGKPVQKATCALCGEIVTDCRHIEQNGKTVCRNCAGQSYYTQI
ncbi:MAG: FmdE family protein [Spirochaetaceae bacterium]|jgi:formylmethanofuran dehydrogenase subunit E|nr:FmdE family protein [Spirochaetaceae bacterium]